MTVVEESLRDQGSGLRAQGGNARGSSSLSPEPSSLSPGKRRSRFATYFTRTGWAHVLLLLAAWMFLFPFVWMLATSVKTDEELMDPGVLPPIVRFQPSSPYVRSKVEPIKPADVTKARWDQMIPTLRLLASAAIEKYQNAHPAPPAIDAIDPNLHRQSASAVLVTHLVAKIDRRLWAGN